MPALYDAHHLYEHHIVFIAYYFIRSSRGDPVYGIHLFDDTHGYCPNVFMQHGNLLATLSVPLSSAAAGQFTMTMVDNVR